MTRSFHGIKSLPNPERFILRAGWAPGTTKNPHSGIIPERGFPARPDSFLTWPSYADLDHYAVAAISGWPWSAGGQG